jgi:hypothetical protein
MLFDAHDCVRPERAAPSFVHVEHFQDARTGRAQPLGAVPDRPGRGAPGQLRLSATHCEGRMLATYETCAIIDLTTRSVQSLPPARSDSASQVAAAPEPSCESASGYRCTRVEISRYPTASTTHGPRQLHRYMVRLLSTVSSPTPCQRSLHSECNAEASTRKRYAAWPINETTCSAA